MSDNESVENIKLFNILEEISSINEFLSKNPHPMGDSIEKVLAFISNFMGSTVPLLNEIFSFLSNPMLSIEAKCVGIYLCVASSSNLKTEPDVICKRLNIDMDVLCEATSELESKVVKNDRASYTKH